MMSPAELVFRIILALLLPPLGAIGLPGVGCGTLLLLFLLAAHPADILSAPAELGSA